MPHATAGLLLLTALACASAETVSVDAAGNAKAAESSAETCGAGDDQGKCGFDDGSGSYASVETGRGAGTDKVSTCGEWCAGAEANAPCAIDTTVMPCQGEYWCTTTCALWTVSILEAATPAARPLTCEQFIRTSAFPRGGEVCSDPCLLNEIKPSRYPAPTGLGFLCAPGTCDPAVQNRYNGTFKATELGLAVLECPCNWFGSDCSDDWVVVERVLRKERLGDFETTVFGVSEADWQRVMAEHRPGGVVRVQAPSPTAWGDRPLEQPYALANDRESGVVGELEVLTGPPETHYHPTVTEVAFRVRALPVGPVAGTPLYINPSVAGFFNKHYRFLLDALEGDAAVAHVAMVASGAGLSGVRTALATLSREGGKALHLFYGLRDVRHLPYRELLVRWVAAGQVGLTLLVSSGDPAAREAPEPEITAAIAAGQKLRAQHAGGGKMYAQHALHLSFLAGSLSEAGAALSNTAVVICGRSELLLDTEALLGELPGSADYLPQRVFMNI